MSTSPRWLYIEHPETHQRVAVLKKDFSTKKIGFTGKTYKELGYEPQYTEQGALPNSSPQEAPAPEEKPKTTSRPSSKTTRKR